MWDTIATVGMLVIFVAVWLAISIALEKKGWNWFLRQIVAAPAGFISGMVFVVVLIALGLVDPEADSAPPSVAAEHGAEPTLAEEDVSSHYRVVSDDLMAPYKRTVEVRVAERLAAEQLEDIAAEIKLLSDVDVERTFIGYRLEEGNDHGAYWATTHYDHELEVRIIGASAEQQEAIEEGYSGPEQYDTVGDVFYSFGDYHEEDGTFELYSDDPLAFRLSQIAIRGQPDSVTYYDNWRAAIYGVYNAFIHTDAEQVSVNAVPLVIDSFTDREGAVLLESESIALSMTRDEALEVANSVLGVDQFEGLKVPAEYGEAWSDSFAGAYYEDLEPGLDRFIEELESHRG